MSYSARAARLSSVLASLDGVAVAFSGGVDSSVLLHAAHAALGQRALGVIADSPSLPRAELEDAIEFARSIAARLEVVRTDELDDARYRANTGQRCYFCKAALFDAMALVAEREQLTTLAFGEITDDLSDDRPGARAAGERQVRAPLREAGMSKDDVRRYAREHGLAVAAKPASACLASRVPVGTPVTRARLATIESAERALRALGYAGVLRVRHGGASARIELGADELARAERDGERLSDALAPAGFAGYELAEYGVSAGRSAAAPAAAPARDS